MFRLLRYFSLAGLLSIIVAALALGLFYRTIAVRAMVEMGQSSNQALTQAIANALWPTLSPYLAEAEQLSTERLAKQAGQSTLLAALRGQLQELSVVQVKVYDLKGRTVFSTDPKQIGEDEGDDEGFQHARNGEVSSELVHRNEFSSFERVVVDRDLLSSYVPIRENGRIVAVFEVYDDLTPFLAKIDKTQRLVVGGVLLVLALLYGVLFLIVRHGATIIRSQYREREIAEAALRESQHTLERRVAERTAELAAANAGLEAEMAERRLVDQRVVHMAHHDALTGLPNRILLNDRIAHDLARAHRTKREVAVLFLDLDRFKNVNDSLGHEVGDQLLKAVATRLESRLREGDTIGRLGGDEFVICLPDLASAAEASSVASDLLVELSRTFDVADHELHADASIGIAVYPRDGDGVETLMRNADAAMYYAKESGRGNYQFFNVQMNERVSRRLSTESRMRRAMELDEFALHFQPIVDLASGRIEMAEALLRWPQFDNRHMSPTEFIPIAEDTGLIVPLGEWVLRESCFKAKSWQALHPGMRVAVNLSPRQFRQKNFLQMVESALGASGLAPELLELELTEGMLMDNAGGTLMTLRGLESMGVQLAIDDFGTGYSSLSYLTRFPIHTLKVDRSFVRDISNNADAAAIVTAIIFMARSLKLKVTAEGVETAEQADFLRSLACDHAQGFYFHRPMSAGDLTQRLQGDGQESGAGSARVAA